MSEPLSYLPLALAAADGHVDHLPIRRLVAAGFTLLQRTPPLVRALSRGRAAILLPTSPAFFVALAACEGRGAVLINPLSSRREIAHQLSDAGAHAVFTTTLLAERLPADMPHVLLDDALERALWVDGDTRRDISLASHDALRIEGASDAEASDEEATIVYTSAMQGYSLGAIATHRNLISNALATIEAAHITGEDRALALLPYSHLFGLVVPALAPLLAGASVLSMPRFNPVRAIESIEHDEITMLVGVPAVFAAISAMLARRGTALEAPKLRLCICGGAPLSRELQDTWFEQTRVELRQGYGLTEAGPVCLFNDMNRPNHRGTMGVSFPGVGVSVRDIASGQECDTDVTGEIWVRGDNVGPGYVSHGDAGLQRVGDWLRTGDLGARDGDGFVRFCGVTKAMFTRNGFNIYPRELERVIGECPGVRGVTVTAVPDAVKENEIAVEVEGDVTEATVRAWCESELAVYKQPAHIIIR